jgi:hypothetical protein
MDYREPDARLYHQHTPLRWAEVTEGCATPRRQRQVGLSNNKMSRPTRTYQRTASSVTGPLRFKSTDAGTRRAQTRPLS